jgi:dihydrofolate reductase
MRKIIVLSYLSLDGFADSNGVPDWIVWDESVNEYYMETQRRTDTVLFGRKSYEALKNYWGTPKAKEEGQDQEMIDYINQTKKIVFSKSLEQADWSNSEVVKDIVPNDIKKMKQQSGKDMLFMGSGSTVSQFANLGLIDEYRFIIIPVVLGEGKPYFRGLEQKLNLNLVETRPFEGGIVLLRFILKGIILEDA